MSEFNLICFCYICTLLRDIHINLNCLTDILKHTPKNNPDHSALDKALSSIREVMTHINEDKRKTEGQLVMFDIFNEIDNCPVRYACIFLKKYWFGAFKFICMLNIFYSLTSCLHIAVLLFDVMWWNLVTDWVDVEITWFYSYFQIQWRYVWIFILRKVIDYIYFSWRVFCDSGL